MKKKADKVRGEVRLSTLEYRAVYREPILDKWHRNGEIAQSVFLALQRWGISLENVSVPPFPTNLSQNELSFQLFQSRYTFRVGMVSTSLAIWNPAWVESGTVKEVVVAGTEAVKQSAGVTYNEQSVSLEIHLAPQGRSIEEITRPFVSSPLADASLAGLSAFGFSLHRTGSIWHLDISAAFAESLYIRIFRTFRPDTPLDDLISAVRKDEAEFLETIGLSIPELS